jgi:predicted AAA+ superfamily ATPase
MTDLQKWREDPKRKPLILMGIRQVGKTWLLKEFGKQFYKDIAYFNFEENRDLASLFTMSKEPERIVSGLSILYGRPIRPGETLLILDEIQECNEALNTLKYFCENAPEYHIACAGSLLGIALSRPASFPVGKVDFLTLKPLTFLEYIRAEGSEALAGYIDGIQTIAPVPAAFFNPLIEKLKLYFLTGGMPEPLETWLEGRDMERVERAHRAIINSYELDFAKHASTTEIPKLRLIWNSIPAQLAKENSKFIYTALRSGARAREYEDAMNWLESAGMVYKIHRTVKPALPLSAYDDQSAFKLYTPDVGLLRTMSGLPASAFIEGNRLFEEFKGALTENFVLQELAAVSTDLPRYWSSGANAEVDFIVRLNGTVLPVEVKASTNLQAKSLRVYRAKYLPSLCLRMSLDNLRFDGSILNVPLFMAGRLFEITRQALNGASPG